MTLIMVFELTGKVVVVTGGANGIGAGAVRRFLEEGAKHVAFLDIAENGPAFEEELNAQYGADASKFYRCDVTDDEQLAAALRGTAARGGPHLVVNNAGIMNDSPGVYKKEIEINVTASITGTIKAIELMRKDKGGGGGTVINVSSSAGLTILPFLPVYWSTKSAILQFSSCIGMAKNYTRTGVRVMTICFGATAGTFLLENCDALDEHMAADHWEHIRNVSTGCQPLEFAMNALIHMYKHGESGSAWLSSRSRPARDITDLVRERSDVLMKILYSLDDDEAGDKEDTE